MHVLRKTIIIYNASNQIACRREKKLRQPFVKKKIRTYALQYLLIIADAESQPKRG